MSPVRLLIAALALFVALWTIIPGLLHTAPPLDVVESGTWGRELVLLSYKHPNLPGLLIEAAYQLTGQYGWPQYLLSALAGGVTIWMVYLLGRDMFGAAAAAAGAALLLGCYYFTWPIPEFNHNIAQLPVWAAIALLLWRVVRDNRWWQWLLLGLVAGIGLYAKLSTLSIVAAGGIWILADATARSRLRSVWAWCGLLIFVAILSFFSWQVASGGGGVVSFVSASGANGSGPLVFVVAQVLDLIPLLVVLGIALGWKRRRDVSEVELAEPRRARLFLTIMFALPLLSAVVASATSGAKDMWATPMFNLVGLLIVAWWPARFDATAIRRVMIGGLVLTLLMPSLFAARHLVTAQTNADPLRAQWPQRQIAERFAAIWEEQTGARLQIVGGNDWVAGLVVLGVSPRASVFFQLSPALSPWVTPQRASEQGVLVVWPGRERPDYLDDLPGAHEIGVESFAWSRSSAARPIEIGYAVVPPAAVR